MIEYRQRMQAVTEPRPAQRWRARFEAMWPGYRDWYLRPDGTARSDRASCERMLATHMPELLPSYARLLDLAGGGDDAARFLTLWNPPRFLPGCSQIAVSTEAGPTLCRNYDYAPELFEGVLWSSRLTEHRVIGMSDCLWGLLDGMNDAGLVVSLTFGGRPGSAEGFAIPLVVRYLLEVATSTSQACRLLSRLPVSMTHNLTMIDRDGAAATAYLAPDRPAEFTATPLATNHRGDQPEFAEQARSLRSVERRATLLRLAGRAPSTAELISAFLAEPLHSTGYTRAFGTLYTAVYQPLTGAVGVHWPELSWHRGFEGPDESVTVTLRDPGRLLAR